MLRISNISASWNQRGIISISANQRGLTEIWTRIAGFRVQSANHYTMRPAILWRKVIFISANWTYCKSIGLCNSSNRKGLFLLKVLCSFLFEKLKNAVAMALQKFNHSGIGNGNQKITHNKSVLQQFLPSSRNLRFSFSLVCRSETRKFISFKVHFLQRSTYVIILSHEIIFNLQGVFWVNVGYTFFIRDHRQINFLTLKGAATDRCKFFRS